MFLSQPILEPLIQVHWNLSIEYGNVLLKGDKLICCVDIEAVITL